MTFARDREQERFLLETITSPQNQKVREAVRLHQSRGRKQQNRIIVFGTREVERAIASGVEPEIVFVCVARLTTQDTVARWEDLGNATSIVQVSEEVYEKLSYGDRGDGVVAVMDRPDTSIASFEPRANGLLVVLEGIEKPGNLGAVFRTADAAAAAGIIVTEPVCDFLHPNSIRNSMGATFSVPAATATNADTMNWLKQQNYRVLIATPHQAESLYESDLTGPCAIVLGNEAVGLSNAWMEGAFERACLPMNGICDSLNVSVTAAVMIFESLRQRAKPTPG